MQTLSYKEQVQRIRSVRKSRAKHKASSYIPYLLITVAFILIGDLSVEIVIAALLVLLMVGLAVFIRVVLKYNLSVGKGVVARFLQDSLGGEPSGDFVSITELLTLNGLSFSQLSDQQKRYLIRAVSSYKYSLSWVFGESTLIAISKADTVVEVKDIASKSTKIIVVTEHEIDKRFKRIFRSISNA